MIFMKKTTKEGDGECSLEMIHLRASKISQTQQGNGAFFFVDLFCFQFLVCCFDRGFLGCWTFKLIVSVLICHFCSGCHSLWVLVCLEKPKNDTARRCSYNRGSVQDFDSDDTQNTEGAEEVEADQEESGKKCLHYATCRNGFFNGIKCSGGRYCTKWGSGGRVCKKYVNCRKGFFNGIKCNGNRYCVTWGLLQEGEEESSQDTESQVEGAESALEVGQETSSDQEVQADQEESGRKCLHYATCRNGFFNGIKCSGGRYCTKWGSGGRVCKKYVNCRKGFFNGIKCNGNRYCVTWGLLQEGEEESSQDTEIQVEGAESALEVGQETSSDQEVQADQEESGRKCLHYATCRNGFFNGIKCSGGRYCTKWGSGGRVCKKYVNCRKGFFNGIKCNGNRYCVTWGLLQEGEEESSQDMESQVEGAESALEVGQETSSDQEVQADQEESGRKCLHYATCRNGFFNGIKCSGGRYCTKWGSGGRVCKKYVNCRKGFFNGIKCNGNRYCVTWGLLQEGEEESSQDTESQVEGAESALEVGQETSSDQEVQADQEESGRKCLHYATCRNGFFNGIKCSGGRYCTKWGSGGRVCKKYVNCRKGFFNGIKCNGNRYCVTWGLLQEGEEESSQDTEIQVEGAESALEVGQETSSDQEVQADQEESGRKCLHYATCRNGFFNGIKCSGGRYCTKWGSGGRVCKKYVNCRKGFFNGIKCNGNRYCVTWGLLQEGEEESSQDTEIQVEGAESALEVGQETSSDQEVQADQEESGRKCLHYATCRNGFFNGIKCSGGRYCTKWGSGGRVCKKYVNCRKGFFNGIKCNGNRYCVTWGLLQEGEEESSRDTEIQVEGAESALEVGQETSSDQEVQADQEESGRKCLHYATCRNGFFNGIKCSGGRYCTKWGSGGRVCKKYVNCRKGFFNGIKCNGNRYCVTWGLLQEGEEESSKDTESQD